MKRSVRVYRYGCPLGVTSGIEALERQLLLAHRCRNKLVEVALSARNEEFRLLAARSEAVRLAEEGVAQAKGTFSSLYRRVKDSRAGGGTAAEEDKAALSSARKILVQGREDLAQARKDARGLLTEDLAAVRVKQQEERNRVRRSFASEGLFWVTGDAAWDQVEAAAKATWSRAQRLLVGDERSEGEDEGEKTDDADARRGEASLRFKRYPGEGAVSVRFKPAIPSAEVFSGQDGSLRIDPLPDGVWDLPRHRRRLTSRTKVRIRVSSAKNTPDGSSAWVELPVIIHRPLPEDGHIVAARVQRERLGLRYVYTLQVTVEAESFAHKEASKRDGVVAVDVGYRKTGDDAEDGLRAGFWLGSDGRAGEIPVDPVRVTTKRATVESMLRKVEFLHSARDRNLDELKSDFLGWLEGLEDVPECLQEARGRIPRWRSWSRVASLHAAWSRARFSGDEAAFTRVGDALKRDRHLLRWEAHQRRRALKRRNEGYSLLMLRLSREYGAIVLEGEPKKKTVGVAKGKAPPSQAMRLDKLSRRGKTECATPALGRTQRMQKNWAALSKLREAAESRFSAAGGAVIFEDARGTSRTCALCGHDELWDNPSEKEHTCDSCGEKWDRDENACRNLLKRYASRGA